MHDAAVRARRLAQLAELVKCTDTLSKDKRAEITAAQLDILARLSIDPPPWMYPLAAAAGL